MHQPDKLHDKHRDASTCAMGVGAFTRPRPEAVLARKRLHFAGNVPIGPTQLSRQLLAGGSDWQKRSIKRYSSGLDWGLPFLDFGRDEPPQVLRRSPLRCDYGRA